jgi:hypothetical protein
MVARIGVNYRGLRWGDRDQIVDAVQTLMEDRGLNAHRAHEVSGVSTSTFTNWLSGKTKRPQNMTVAAFTTAIGAVRRDDIDEDGTLIIGFRDVGKFNYTKEREKQATWMIRQGRGPKKKKRRKKKKSNGHAA